jgi:hypothetical protein
MKIIIIIIYRILWYIKIIANENNEDYYLDNLLNYFAMKILMYWKLYWWWKDKKFLEIS